MDELVDKPRYVDHEYAVTYVASSQRLLHRPLITRYQSYPAQSLAYTSSQIIMHYFSVLTLASMATAIPVVLVPRQLDRTSTTEHEFSLSLRCGKVVFVWARGSTELGNMGTVIGPPLGDELRKESGLDLQIERVDYVALLSTNYLPGGTDLATELEMRGVLNDINRRCPKAVIVTGGYQAAAVNHRAIEDLNSAVLTKD
ncbi:carbohydrate esterase family 5 protein [Karstenula rhodostoma CBS 690.94]|uniref:cutinase n=1 Tax=Karstenula rhodostoma CBS 690.94 TaxID=1392251 RepID=A0A9P4PL23_9PLEO|nr:carbohydrate esterase family 5 protein [Karstenula rhodostoma CBS 690.94]